MKKIFVYISAISLLNIGCTTLNEFSFENFLNPSNKNITSEFAHINKNAGVLYKRIETPNGYVRVIDEHEFSNFLRNLTIKPHGTNVKNFDGSIKENTNLYSAVLNLPISNKNKQVYSNAVFRLRNEYFYQTKKYNRIRFDREEKSIPNFISYSNTKDYSVFLSYLDYAYDNLSPSSLSNYTSSVALKDIHIGDIFYQNSGTKSHAVMVLDMAENMKGERVVLLAQSYYPSQEIHIINNTENPDISPWFEIKKGVILTPEWRFMSTDLVRFDENR
ncbi:DUF4846 domain-containing protein [Weeksella virosa]|uniref:Lipoprotein n=1 Tax=Weeksella virosa (strain ATCC 43766 / DSM 16922 / JCM 21250 / CCUG 30538 / CDC 9751 / IAM 14551 / NBRC 16016 / NCTC 11634 / CL345/78) TaxID=865938 RepID=F0P113_WEEVC|nr:DUF4846 domain-containing protein [Weeksella virosa]ADX68597.1 hypothetical protein Weevi_1912 [Weeksella virosa DSM 16922]MDK7675228.1 DUF4846 domain-containing protein [Weeksella virosa]VEH63740.1 Uncharacterised protein [Weeksella virosa]